MSNTDDIPQKLDWVARLLCLFIGATFGVGAAFAFAGWHTSGVWFWLLGAVAILFLIVALFGPRSWRSALISAFPVGGW